MLCSRRRTTYRRTDNPTTRIVVRCCYSCVRVFLRLLLLFRITFEGNCHTMPTTQATQKRRGSVTITVLPSGVLQWHTRRGFLVPSSMARPVKTAK